MSITDKVRLLDDVGKLLEILQGLDDKSTEAFAHKLANPKSGRLVFVPWGCGSKCVPGFQPDERDDEDTHGGRC